jgi:hypothetical protein
MERKTLGVGRRVLAAVAGILFAGLAVKYPQLRDVLPEVERIVLALILGITADKVAKTWNVTDPAALGLGGTPDDAQ